MTAKSGGMGDWGLEFASRPLSPRRRPLSRSERGGLPTGSEAARVERQCRFSRKSPVFIPRRCWTNCRWTPADRRWFALYTKARQEKSLARELLKHRIPFYLPLVKKTNVSRGRKRISLMPLFGGYVFLYRGGRGAGAMPGHEPDLSRPHGRAARAACLRLAAVPPADRRQRPADGRKPAGAGPTGAACGKGRLPAWKGPS